MRLGAVNSLGLPVSDMGDDILSWPGKRGVPEVGRVTDMEGVARGKEVRESALRDCHGLFDSGDGNIRGTLLL